MADGYNDLPEQPAESTPELLSARGVSLAGVLERVTDQFAAETEARPDILDMTDAAERRRVLVEIVEYVLTVEGIRLSREDRLRVIEVAYNDLFLLGALHPLLRDPEVSEIEITAHDRIYARRGAQKTLTDLRFRDDSQLERVLRRALIATGERLYSGEPLIEVGTRLAERPARLTITTPPISPTLQASIRLHAAQPRSLADLVNMNFLSADAAAALERAIAQRRGIMLAGDVESGKTTLLQALLPLVSAQAGRHAVAQRAAELILPENISNVDGSTFAARLSAARDLVGESGGWLIADEIRFDESAAMWDALTSGLGDRAPRLLWAFRAATDPLRLRIAFSMAVRRAVPSIDQSVIHSGLLDRLPVVALLARRDGVPRLIRLGIWRAEGDSLSLA
ncbi:MAG: ATPase, T2SS/T4P/T4SS family [Anaerolineae bacterium]|nr:ATPase, T2SS/T4P/T4SS family [Anaerolineae bacterium]